MPVTVRKAKEKNDFKAFFEFPWKIYKDDPNWAPPLLSMRQELLDEKKNPSWDYLNGDYYVAWRDNEPVGTIAAFVNQRHNEMHGENIAWFGAFEVVNDQEAANALLNTAAEWAQANGYHALRGPQTFTNMEECGLLIDGFERQILLMPYNPPYYQQLIEAAGFHKVMDTFSFYGNWDTVDGETKNVRDRFSKLVERIQKRGNITARPLDRRKLKQEFELFKEIYNTAWEKNWGFVPFTSKELDALVKSLGMIFDPRLACFGYVDGEPAGFIFAVPDISQVLHRVKPRPGVPEVFSLIATAWHWKVRGMIDWIRIPLMGVVEKHRNKGVDLVMYNQLLKALEGTPYKHLDAGWILETNQPMMQILKNLEMEVHRTYRFYEKPLNEAVLQSPDS